MNQTSKFRQPAWLESTLSGAGLGLGAIGTVFMLVAEDAEQQRFGGLMYAACLLILFVRALLEQRPVQEFGQSVLVLGYGWISVGIILLSISWIQLLFLVPLTSFLLFLVVLRDPDPEATAKTPGP